jgi:hypothetical protein
VDMAGGWEEVVAVGSWIGTGDGTSGEVGSKDEVGKAAESKEGVGEAAEGK